MSVRVLIADDHAMIRDGLKMILESQADIQVVGGAANGQEAIALAEAHLPGVVLMDISMPVLNGIEAARIIGERWPATRIIVMSMHNTSEYIFRAIRAGARGYLLKESAGDELIEAVRAVVRGQHYFGSGVELPPGGLAAESGIAARSPLDTLSRREREILQLVAEGRSSAEIAALLCLSPKSIDTYRSRLMVKLGVTNSTSLVRFALQHGLTPG